RSVSALGHHHPATIHGDRLPRGRVAAEADRGRVRGKGSDYRPVAGGAEDSRFVASEVIMQVPTRGTGHRLLWPVILRNGIRASNGTGRKNRWPVPHALIILAMVLNAQQPPAGGRRGGGGGPVQAPLEETGYQSLFDGQSLKGWDCDPDFWHIENGVMVGETRKDHMPKQNIFCIWRDGKPADFDLKLQYRLTGEGGNSGIQYRSIERPEVGKWVMQGYQADIDVRQQFTGQIYEERGRGFLANRGNMTYISDGKRPGLIGSVGDNAALKEFIKNDDWNDIEVVARGNTIVQLINGHVMSILIDDD